MILGAALALMLPQTVTFEHPCASAKVVLEALGKEIGRDLRVSGSVNDDYIVVRFDGVPVQQALDKLAKTLNATWTQEGAITYLGRTRPQDVQDFEAEYAEKLKMIKEATKLPTGPEFDAAQAERLAIQVRDFGPTRKYEDWLRFQPLAFQLPGHRAMLELIALLDLDTIVRTTYSPVQFSSMAEQPLPRGADAVIARLSREWAVYANASARAGVQSDDVYQKLAGGAEDLAKKLQLSAHISPENVLFTLNVLGETGWLAIGNLRIPYDSGGDVPAWVAGLDEKVEASEAAFQSVLPSTIEQGNPALARALTEDSTTDPVLAFPADVLLQAARLRKESLVASLPDDAYRKLSTSDLPRDATVTSVLTTLFASRCVKSEEGDGWITVRPTAPYRGRYLRLDRQAFQRMCRYAQTKHSLSLDVFADFVATSKRDDTVEMAIGLFDRAIAHTSPMSSLGIKNIRLYGLLPAADRERAKKEPVVFNERADAQKYSVALAVVADSFFEYSQAPPGPGRPFMEERDAAAGLPKGVVWSIMVTPETFMQPGVHGIKAGSWNPVYTVSDFAMNSVWAERNPSLTETDFTKVAPLFGWSLPVSYGDDARRSGGTAFSHFVDPMTPLKFGSVNDLSPDLRDEVLKKQEEFRKQRGGG